MNLTQEQAGEKARKLEEDFDPHGIYCPVTKDRCRKDCVCYKSASASTCGTRHWGIFPSYCTHKHIDKGLT